LAGVSDSGGSFDFGLAAGFWLPVAFVVDVFAVVLVLVVVVAWFVFVAACFFPPPHPLAPSIKTPTTTVAATCRGLLISSSPSSLGSFGISGP
jgi:hypothetical protein